VGAIIENARRVPLVLAGFGHVGKAFFELIQEKNEYLQNRYGLDLKLQDIKVEGITEIPPELLARAQQEGKAFKLIGSMTRTRGRWEAEVSPKAIDHSHPLFGVNETNKGISFLTDSMGSVTVTGGKSNPRGAAAALLKDIIHIFSCHSFQ